MKNTNLTNTDFFPHTILSMRPLIDMILLLSMSGVDESSRLQTKLKPATREGLTRVVLGHRPDRSQHLGGRGGGEDGAHGGCCQHAPPHVA